MKKLGLALGGGGARGLIDTQAGVGGKQHLSVARLLRLRRRDGRCLPWERCDLEVISCGECSRIRRCRSCDLGT